MSKFLCGLACLALMNEGLRAEQNPHVEAPLFSNWFGGEKPRVMAPTPVLPEHVMMHELLLTDEQRSRREIAFRAYVPDGKGPFPTVLFSPGLGETKDSYSYLLTAWAEAGYLVLIPTHKGTGRDDLNLLGTSVAARGLRAIQLTADQMQWRDRTADMQFLLAHAGELEPLKDKIDKANVALTGHSYGAHTTMLGVGAKANFKQPPPGPVTLPQARVAIAISPQGEKMIGMKADSWDAIHVPILYMRGEKDAGIFGDPPSARDHGFQRSPADGSKYLAVVEGAHSTHEFFIEGGQTPDAKQSMKDIQEVTLKFLDRHLKGKPGDLTTDGVTAKRITLSNK